MLCKQAGGLGDWWISASSSEIPESFLGLVDSDNGGSGSGGPKGARSRICWREYTLRRDLEILSHMWGWKDKPYQVGTCSNLCELSMTVGHG